MIKSVDATKLGVPVPKLIKLEAKIGAGVVDVVNPKPEKPAANTSAAKPAAKPSGTTVAKPVGTPRAAPAAKGTYLDKPKAPFNKLPGLTGDLTNDPIATAHRDRVAIAGDEMSAVKDTEVKANKI